MCRETADQPVQMYIAIHVRKVDVRISLQVLQSRSFIPEVSNWLNFLQVEKPYRYHDSYT